MPRWPEKAEGKQKSKRARRRKLDTAKAKLEPLLAVLRRAGCPSSRRSQDGTFGIGQVSGDRGDKLDIEFVSTGSKTLLKSTELKPASPPSPDFKVLKAKGKSWTPQFKAERPPRRPPLDLEVSVNNTR
jgi:hypothetical protein